MDKKKVKELIFKAHHYIEEVFDRQADNNNAIDAMSLADASIILLTAINELSKSDWVSVEDGLPPYGEEVFVTSKMSPDNVFKNKRTECTTVPKDGNDFIILWEGRMARITHWKPIKKLED